MSYDIDHGVPLPKTFGKGRGRKPIYPFGALNIGDSFAFKAGDYDKVVFAMAAYKARHFPWDYRVSKLELRCWRVKDRPKKEKVK